MSELLNHIHSTLRRQLSRSNLESFVEFDVESLHVAGDFVVEYCRHLLLPFVTSTTLSTRLPNASHESRPLLLVSTPNTNANLFPFSSRSEPLSDAQLRAIFSPTRDAPSASCPVFLQLQPCLAALPPRPTATSARPMPSTALSSVVSTTRS